MLSTHEPPIAPFAKRAFGALLHELCGHIYIYIYMKDMYFYIYLVMWCFDVFLEFCLS